MDDLIYFAGVMALFGGVTLCGVFILAAADPATPRWFRVLAIAYIIGFLVFLGSADHTAEKIKSLKGAQNVVNNCADSLGDCICR